MSGINKDEFFEFRQTYSACVVNLNPSTNSSDVFTIRGGATRTVYIHKVIISGTRTTHRRDVFTLVRRSTNNTGGTSLVRTVVPYDSNNLASTCEVRSYTANPTLGTLVGEVYTQNVSLSVLQPSNAQGNGTGVVPFKWEPSEVGQPIILRGVTQILAVNTPIAFPAGALLNITVEWSEE